MALAPGLSRLGCSAGSVMGLLATLVSPGLAQNGSAGLPSFPAVAPSYEQRYQELTEAQPLPNAVAPVSWLVLNRDVARFTFESGNFYLLTPVSGRTVAAVFVGKGVFTFSPPTPIEQERLVRYQKTRSLAVPFSSAAFLFADSTLSELRSKITFGAGQPPYEVRQRFKALLDMLGDDDSKSLDPDLMSAVLNDEANGVFFAQVIPSGGGPLLFTLNPREVEGVSLSQRVRRYGWTRRSEVISKFPPGRQVRDLRVSGERLRDASIKHYRITTRLTPSGSGDLSFAAAAELDITAGNVVGPWIAFSLFEKLRVDSARWEDGTPATVFKGQGGTLLWVRLPNQLQPEESRRLSLHYQGDLIDREDDFFFIKSSAEWYPRPLEGRSLATFDLTFHSPKGKLLASVGDQVESSTSGQVTTSRWVSTTPIRNASFNLGFFKDYKIQEQGIPPVTVLLAEDVHRRIGALRQKNMKQIVGADVAKSLRFFQHVYGTVPTKHFFATEIPYFHGEAFPGLVHLSWATFHQTDQDGLDEVFRAHEVAHQWWGIGVDFTSYHDQWLS